MDDNRFSFEDIKMILSTQPGKWKNKMTEDELNQLMRVIDTGNFDLGIFMPDLYRLLFYLYKFELSKEDKKKLKSYPVNKILDAILDTNFWNGINISFGCFNRSRMIDETFEILFLDGFKEYFSTISQEERVDFLIKVQKNFPSSIFESFNFLIDNANRLNITVENIVEIFVLIAKPLAETKCYDYGYLNSLNFPINKFVNIMEICKLIKLFSEKYNLTLNNDRFAIIFSDLLKIKSEKPILYLFGNDFSNKLYTELFEKDNFLVSILRANKKNFSTIINGFYGELKRWLLSDCDYYDKPEFYQEISSESIISENPFELIEKRLVSILTDAEKLKILLTDRNEKNCDDNIFKEIKKILVIEKRKK